MTDFSKFLDEYTRPLKVLVNDEGEVGTWLEIVDKYGKSITSLVPDFWTEYDKNFWELAVHAINSLDLDNQIETNKMARAEIIEKIKEIREYYSEDIFLPNGESVDAQSADMARITCDNIIGAIAKLTKGDG